MKLSRALAIQILNAGLATGADYAEIYYQDNMTHSYTRRYKKVYSVTGGRTSGIGIRLIKGVKVVYGYTSDLSKKALLELASSLALGFEGERVLTVNSLKEKKFAQMNPIKIPHSSWDVEKKLAYLEDGEKVAYAVSDKIQDVLTRLMEEDEHVEIYNSDGIYTSDERTRTRLACAAFATDGTQFQQGFVGPGVSKGLEFLEETDFKAVCKETAETAIELLSAPEGPSGEMPVVLGNYFGGVLFHEACGHPLEGCSIARGTSPFADKLGKKVASDVVTAIDDGTIENAWGSESVDDEGIAPTKNVLIKDGVLVSYMVDRYNGRRINADRKLQKRKLSLSSDNPYDKYLYRCRFFHTGRDHRFCQERYLLQRIQRRTGRSFYRSVHLHIRCRLPDQRRQDRSYDQTCFLDRLWL